MRAKPMPKTRTIHPPGQDPRRVPIYPYEPKEKAMSTAPKECSEDMRVTVRIGDTVCTMTVSGELLRQAAEDVDMPPAFLCEDNYEKRMIRRALVPIVRRAAEQAASDASWDAVSKLLQLDPEKGR
jgi:hypothetical protein